MMAPMEAVERVLAPEFTVHLLPAPDLRTRFLGENGARIRGIVAYRGATNVDRAVLARLENTFQRRFKNSHRDGRTNLI